MVSVDTSYLGSAAKFNTRDIDKLIAIVKKRISTGVQFTTPRENATAYSAVQQFEKGLASANATIVSIAKNKAIVDTAATGVKAVGSTLALMASKLQALVNGTGDQLKAVGELQTAQNTIKYSISSAVENRANILNGSYSGNLVLSLGSGGAIENTLYLRPEDVYKISSSGNSGYLGGSNSVLDTPITWQLVSNKDNAKAFLQVVNQAITRNNVHEARLTSYSQLLATQSQMMTDLADARSQAISKLVDIDMDDEKARLVALVARKKLITDTLSIANNTNSAQNILNLFQNSRNAGMDSNSLQSIISTARAARAAYAQ